MPACLTLPCCGLWRARSGRRHAAVQRRRRLDHRRFFRAIWTITPRLCGPQSTAGRRNAWRIAPDAATIKRKVLKFRAAVDMQDIAADPARRVRGKEGDNVADVVGLRDALQ